MAICCARTMRSPRRASATCCASTRTTGSSPTPTTGSARPCSSASATAMPPIVPQRVHQVREILQGAGRAAAARTIAGGAQGEGGGVRHLGRARTQVSPRLAGREAGVSSANKSASGVSIPPPVAWEGRHWAPIRRRRPCVHHRISRFRRLKPRRCLPTSPFARRWCWRCPAAPIRPRCFFSLRDGARNCGAGLGLRR